MTGSGLLQRVKAKKDLDIVGLGSAHVAFFVEYPPEKIHKEALDYNFTPYTASRLSKLPPLEVDVLGRCFSTVEDSLVIASRFGAKTALIAKRGDDELGRYFAEQMADYGVQYDTPPLKGGETFKARIYVDSEKKEPTIISVTGASDKLDDQDIDENLIRHSKFFLSDAYNLIEPDLRQSVLKASDMAQKHDTKIVFGLGREVVVRDHREAVEGYIEKYKPHVLDGNRDEYSELVHAQGSDIDTLTKRVQEYVKQKGVEIAVITLGMDGARILVTGDEVVHVPAIAVPKEKIVDLTCAGDSFLGGFLAGLSSGKPVDVAGEWGAYAASLTIQRHGIKPEQNYKEITEHRKPFAYYIQQQKKASESGFSR